MELTVGFEPLNIIDMEMPDGGCKICTAGAVIGGAGTGAGTVLAVGAIFSVTPAGWIVGLGAVAGAGLGYLATR